MKRTVTFRFWHPRSASVALVGDFNSWDISAHPMSYDAEGDVWTLTLELEPGRYEYKFFVDGRTWWNDPDAPSMPNPWGSENSYVDVD